MKSFGDLHVRLKGLSPEEFSDRAAGAATSGWARDRLSQDAKGRGTDGGTLLTFALTGHKSLPPAILFLAEKSPGVLYVPNVISPARDRLDYDEYNDILKSFCDGVLSHVQPPHAVEFDLTGTSIDLAKQLPERVYKRLQSFSALANKTTGSAQSLDRERWLDFLIAVVEEGAVLTPNALARWLVEEGHWDDEQASRLADEYKLGRELLQRRRQAS
jgi:hypothetical protein